MMDANKNSFDWIKVTRWVIFSILLPLFPMLLALLVLIGQGRTVHYESLLGGTEIYILSVTVLASTKNDLDNSRANFSRSRIYSLLTVFLLPYAIFISMVFGVVYINEYVDDFGLAESFIANVGILLGIIASIICVSLQVMLSVAEG